MKSHPALAAEWEQRIQTFIHRHIRPYITELNASNMAVDKLLGSTGAWARIGTRRRWPYRWIPQRKTERLRPIARAELPELMNAVDNAPGTARRPPQVFHRLGDEFE